GFLEFIADPESPMHKPALSSGRRLILYCASGGRSALAAKTLRDMGIAQVCHMAGGFGGWVQSGGPAER
ncbi:MAG TPA: rhodanese-like domain-containing protein, partial [Alphaproteobacteria bacterium]|nr:rhodanese-like domain-containing protein [Alphaproteobacteria bacterium]